MVSNNREWDDGEWNFSSDLSLVQFSSVGSRQVSMGQQYGWSRGIGWYLKWVPKLPAFTTSFLTVRCSRHRRHRVSAILLSSISIKKSSFRKRQQRVVLSLPFNVTLAMVQGCPSTSLVPVYQQLCQLGGWVSEQFLNGTSAQYRLCSAILLKLYKS